ncbi:hypothetical protein Q5Y75_02165 [Ruegeria sp. 2205SS24-7]|uniref:hypothetical protein n=1 Tax=Ruegeria discodermiae TaxID=3064389 RepID=UPI0027420B9B|nr:hypothetical protein [Ruegeria sp. 2205SS24-7]MDP5216013.1 hypothetical protein [Ruegeria sp. 2205SS24-7]
MARGSDPLDPKGLIREAYRIDGITPPECRSIFLDWALSLPAEVDQNTALRTLHDRFGAETPDHPMTEVLAQGLKAAQNPRRRGGWRSRERG